jgi:hypothetical protein
MLSIKAVSESASAERLAEQVLQFNAEFFEEQEEQAMRGLRVRGIYIFPGDPDAPISLHIQAMDAGGAALWLPLREGDEVRDAAGLCLSCRLPVGSKRRAACFLHCRNASERLYPIETKPVPLGDWILTRDGKRISLRPK